MEIFSFDFCDNLLDPFLDDFQSLFGAILGATFCWKIDLKSASFLRGSWRLSGAILGGFLAVLGLSWEAIVFQSTVKNKSKSMFLKIVCYRDLSFLGPLSGAILAHFSTFWPQK